MTTFTRARSSVLVLTLLLALGCARTPSQASAREQVIEPGALVVIGGRLEPDNAALFEAMLELRHGRAPICVIPTASAEPESSMDAYLADFERYGGSGSAVGIALIAGDLAAASSPELAQRLRECGGFFFTGGDQSRIVDTFKPGGQPSLAYRTLLERHRQGAFVAGTSAGAAMISDPMIGGGDSSLALRHGVCDHDGCDGVWVRDGMGLWPGWITDQHFLVRGRAGRLLVVLVDHPGGPRLGLGVDEDTGVIVRGGVGEVVGRSGALRIDASAAGREGDTWAGITMALYGPGDRFDLADGRLLAAGAGDGEGMPAPALPPADAAVFDGFEFTQLLLSLAAAEAGGPGEPGPQADAQVRVTGDGWSVTIARGPEFHAGPRWGPQGIGAAGPFVVELSRAR